MADKKEEFNKIIKKLKSNIEENIKLQKELQYYIDFLEYDIDDLDIIVNEPEELDIYKFKGQHNYEYLFNFDLEKVLKQQQGRKKSIDNINRDIDIKERDKEK